MRKVWFFCLGLVCLCTASLAQASIERPNIVLILLDDLGYADVGFTPNSAADIHTPSIDALAQQGVVFDRAYVTHSYCGPSRAGLMTGRYQHEFGAQFNLSDYSAHGVSTEETFFSKVLQDSGYRTGLVGKWHLGEDPQYRPNVRGFDYFYGMLGGGHVYHTSDFVRVADYDPNNKSIWQYKTPLMENEEFASEAGYDENRYITDMLTDAGVDFITRESTKDSPFFLFMSYNAPHTPEQAKSSDEQALKKILGENAATEAKRLTYTAMVYAVDRGVARIVEKLKEVDQFDNTLIVFLSDNGGRINDASANNAPFRAGKTSVYEGGIRVPMFWHWPAGLTPSRYPHVVSALDLYPTFLSLAGARVPEHKQLDGFDLSAAVTTSKNVREDVPLYFVMHIPDRGLNQSAVVQGSDKWFTNGDGHWRYFDLREDPRERTPLKNADKDLVQSLYDWTCTHIRPEWFDDSRYGWEKAWDQNAMPNWKKTFPLLYSASHCSGKKD